MSELISHSEDSVQIVVRGQHGLMAREWLNSSEWIHRDHLLFPGRDFLLEI